MSIPNLTSQFPHRSPGLSLDQWASLGTQMVKNRIKIVASRRGQNKRELEFLIRSLHKAYAIEKKTIDDAVRITNDLSSPST